MRAVLHLVVVGLAVAVIAGCSAAGDVDTRPAAPTLPPRPSSVAVDRVRPCTTLAPEQVQRLGLRRPTPIEVVVDGQPSRGCTWIGPAIGFNVQVIPIGTEVAVAVPGSAITQINGFGAVRNILAEPGPPPTCQVAVDVAPGQTIRVQANAVPNPPYGLDELCRRADEAASMVMTTVVATAPR